MGISFTMRDLSATNHHASLEAIIPAELRTLNQWVCWRYETRDGKPTKPPISPRSNGKLLYAKSNDPATWSDFATATAAVTRLGLQGVGLSLSESDGLTGLDLDHVFDPATGEIDPLAANVLERFGGTYAEVSPSGTGIRIWCYGKPQRSGKCAGKVKWLEVYSHPSNRYLTVTGNHWPSSATTVTDQQSALDWLHAQFMSTPEKTRPTTQSQTPDDLDDAELLSKAFRAKNGATFAALWAGDTSNYHGDDSAADLALCNLLAFWTGNDSSRIDRLFRQSGLFRGKWDERHGEQTYGELTVAKAVNGNRTTYSGKLTLNQHQHHQNLPIQVDSETQVLIHLPTVSPCTHLANSYRIQHYYKDQIFFVLGMGWLVWTGKFWKTDPTSDNSIATGFVNGLSKYIAKESAYFANLASQENDKTKRTELLENAEDLLKWAIQSENQRVIFAGLQLSKYALLVEYSTLNADPWLFNVQNGTLDLRCGTLRPHNPHDLIAFISPVEVAPIVQTIFGRI